MDGFAIKAKDSLGASKENPKIFEIIEDLPAGYTTQKTIKPYQAVRIMTGAPLPKAADSVVMVEDTLKVTSDQKKRTCANF
jgi:molybdopterin molybdotransferase